MKIEREKDNKPLIIRIDGVMLQQVEWFKYLGSIVTEDGRDIREIKARIAMDRSAFNNLERVSKDRSIQMSTRLRILKCYFWCVVRYALECWIISAEVECRINAFEMWCYRRMNRIRWVDRITNVEVLRRTGTEMSLMKWIKENKKKYIDDTRENDRLFAVASSGVTVGKLSRGRRQGSILSL